MDWPKFEEMVFGKASRSDGSPPATSTQQPPSPFRQPMAWIKTALGLQSGNPPQVLDTRFIVPAMDTMQGGWPFAIYEGVGVQIGGVTGGGDIFNVTTASVGFQLVLLALAVVHTSAAAQHIQFYIGDIPSGGVGTGPNFAQVPAIPQPTTGVAVALSPVQAMLVDATIAAGSFLSTIGAIASRIVVIPPGLPLMAKNISALGAGELLTVHVAWARIPAGFQVY